jgi:hypothetical protein
MKKAKINVTYRNYKYDSFKEDEDESSPINVYQIQ